MAATVPDYIQPPANIELKQSSVDDRRVGAFCLTELIAKDAEFGPFQGKIVYDKNCEDVDQKFSWEVYDLETFKYLHTVDATDPSDGNWMRYVCCARYFEEQNIVSNQHGAEVYYRALKDIHPGEELLTWFQPKKKRKRSSLRDSIESSLSSESMKEPIIEDSLLGLGKRKRKPKIIPDSYQGPLDFKITSKYKKPDDDEFEPLQPGQKRRRRKKVKPTVQDDLHESESSECQPPNLEGKPSLEIKEEQDQEAVKIEQSKEAFQKSRDKDLDMDTKVSNETKAVKKFKAIKKEKVLCLREANKLVDWQFPAKGEEYIFRLKRYHIHYISKGKKAYKCEICMGLYKQMFSLKRHYLRNHINYKYLSKADIANCSINLKYVKQMMYERTLMKEWKKKKENGEQVDESQNSFFEKLDKTVKSLSNDNKDSNNLPAQDKKDKTDCPSDKDSIEQIKGHDIDDNEAKIECERNDLKIVNPEQGSEVEHSNSSPEQQMSLTEVSNDLHKESEALSNSIAQSENVVVDIKTEVIDEELLENKHLKENDSNNEIDYEIQILSIVKKENENSEIKDITSPTLNPDQSENPAASYIKPENNEINDIEFKESVITDLKPGNNVDNIVGEKMPGLYRCYTCFEAYDTVDEIRKHLEDHPLQALCFACDQCNMRFHFKQNLVRHKKVHEKENTDEVKKPKKWAKQMGDDAKILKRLNKKKEKAMAMAEPCKIPVIEPKGTSDYLFKCNKCKQIFQNQKTLTEHVQEQHKDGSKFQCQYCGKDFPSMPNMKKHVRFHLGYRVRCRTCSEIFSNVGALRKHIRLVHPEIYKAKREEKQTKEDSSTAVDKPTAVLDNNTVNEQGDNLSTELKKNQIRETEQNNSDSPKDSSKGADDIFSETDITFEAHEIDDGGSRFKYSCSVCKKRFSSYINMRRHRRKVHSGNRQKLEEGLIFTRKTKIYTPPVEEDRKELEQFYANVSHNIAINLNCYIDGKSESLEKYTDHIIVEDYKSGSFGYSEHSEQKIDIVWEEYNFPPDFISVSTLPVSEKQTDLNSESKDLPDLNNLDRSESLTETEKTDSLAVSSDRNNIEDHSNIDQVEEIEAESMGKPSNGIKTIANVGISAVQKITKSLENLMNDSNKPETLVSKLPSKIFSKNSPSTKNFCQVTNGEYSNFDDLMLGDDFSTIARDTDECKKDDDRLTRNRAHSSASARRINKKPRYKRSHSAGDLLDEEQMPDNMRLRNTSEDLYRESQAELDELYDSIDMGVECSPHKIDTPKSLSNLCEGMLGLKAASSCRKLEAKNDADNDVVDNHRKPKASTQLFTNLSLSSNEEKEMTKKTKQELQPDYSDASLDSPFYNYDSIAFGKNGEISKVCAVCKTHFDDFDSLVNHHWKKHPLSACNYLEVEEGNDIESLHFAYPTNIGVLAESCPALSTVSDSGSFHCTRCGGVFKSKARLHVHIVNCSPIDPVYGAVKVTSSPGKSPIKRSPTAFGQSDMNNHLSSSQKRVFTGCRKRTALLLPDSPVKMALTDKNIQDIMSGYNPNKHIRRRELTELVDTLTCEACGQKFKTIILLERHVKHCAEKEKFKNVRPLACPILDESLAKLKNICFYCDKNFTYSKSLINHFQDFCPIKKMKIDKGDLTYEDKMREAKIMNRILKLEVEKVNKDKDTDGQNKRPWQVGRKPKRKGHSWTYIKKRGKQMAGDDHEMEENDELEGEPDESVVNTSTQNGQNTPEKDSQKFHDANGNFMVKYKGTKMTNLPMEYDEVDSLSSFNEEPIHIEKYDNNILSSQEIGIDINKVSSNVPELHNKIAQVEEATVVVEQDKASTPTDKNVVNNGIISDEEVKDEEKSIYGTHEIQGNWNVDANTSLDFTRRYKVNQISLPKKEATTRALFMQCVTPNESSPVSTNGRVERSKRKRERCGKVEAFLQNVFKRKKKKEALMAKESEKSIVQAKVFHEDSKGNISDFGNRLTNFEILNVQNDTRMTYVSNDFRLDEDKNMIHSERYESKREENGNVRYLFKRGRPRKHPLPENFENSETKVKKEENKCESKTEDKTVPDTDIKVNLPEKDLKETETSKSEKNTNTCTTKRPRGRPRKKRFFPNLIHNKYNEEDEKVKQDCIENVTEDEEKKCAIKSEISQSDDSEFIPKQINKIEEEREPIELTKSSTTGDTILNEQDESSAYPILKSNVESIGEQKSENCKNECSEKPLCEAERTVLCNKSPNSTETMNTEISIEQNKDSAITNKSEEIDPERITSNLESITPGAKSESENDNDFCDTALKASNVKTDEVNVNIYTCNENSDVSLPKATNKVPSDSKQSLNTESTALTSYDSEDQVVITNEIDTKSNDTSDVIVNSSNEGTEKISEIHESGKEQFKDDTNLISLVGSSSSTCVQEDATNSSDESNTDSSMSEQTQKISVQADVEILVNESNMNLSVECCVDPIAIETSVQLNESAQLHTKVSVKQRSEIQCDLNIDQIAFETSVPLDKSAELHKEMQSVHPVDKIAIETGVPADEHTSVCDSADSFNDTLVGTSVPLNEPAGSHTEVNVEMKSENLSETCVESNAAELSVPVAESISKQDLLKSIPKQDLVESIPEENLVESIPKQDLEDSTCIPKQDLEESIPKQDLEESIPKQDLVESIPKQDLPQSIPKQDSNDQTEADKDFLSDFYSSVILSPSERVKTNKRSCKKEPSPFSPVWVRQKPKAKTLDIVNSKPTASVESNKDSSNQCVSEIEKQIKDSANGYLKDIPKALKRKLEIVRKFDSCKNNSQK